MTLNFVKENFIIGQASPDLSPQFVFYKRGFNLGGSSGGDWKDITIKGVGSLTLVNAKANSLSSLKLFGGCEQSGTPTPTVPVNIVCNNGAIKHSINELNPDDIEIGYYRVQATGVLTESPYNFITGFMPVKPSQSYVFFGRRIEDNRLSSYNRIHWFDASKEFISTNTYTKDAIGTGVAPANAYFAQCSCNESGATSRETTQAIVDGYNWVFQIGTTEVPYTPYSPNGIYTDGTVETVGVYGNNIFNKNDTENIGGWYSGSNQTITQANANETLVMRAKPNTTYYFKHCSVKGGCRAFYTEVEDWEIGSACTAMSGNAGANANVVYSITTSANAKWIFFNCGRNNVEASFDEQRNDFMVSTSELTSDTPYEAYYNGGSATAEMLLAIDDNKDEHNVTSGDVIRKIGIKIFDGSETFTASTAYGKACLIQGASNSWGADRSEAVLCTHFLGMPTTTSEAEDYTCFFNATGHFYFRLEDNTVATFKQFLADQYNAGTPVIVFFVKATPTTETATPQPLTIKAGTNVVEITQASIDNLELEVSYKAGVEVTVTEIENAQLDNSVEVTVNG